jgi:hypothetical protein
MKLANFRLSLVLRMNEFSGRITYLTNIFIIGEE